MFSPRRTYHPNDNEEPLVGGHGSVHGMHARSETRLVRRPLVWPGLATWPTELEYSGSARHRADAAERCKLIDPSQK